MQLSRKKRRQKMPCAKKENAPTEIQPYSKPITARKKSRSSPLDPLNWRTRPGQLAVPFGGYSLSTV